MTTGLPTHWYSCKLFKNFEAKSLSGIVFCVAVCNHAARDMFVLYSGTNQQACIDTFTGFQMVVVRVITHVWFIA